MDYPLSTPFKLYCWTQSSVYYIFYEHCEGYERPHKLGLDLLLREVNLCPVCEGYESRFHRGQCRFTDFILELDVLNEKYDRNNRVQRVHNPSIGGVVE